MKYNALQFINLVECLTILSEFLDLQQMNPSNLHYLVFQQHSDGQKHNRLVNNNGTLQRAYILDGDQLKENNGVLLEFPKFDFQLYPQGCNDNHIETAVKKAIKQIYIQQK